MTVRFYLVDVFTTQPLSGNPLAVVTGGQALSFDTMQRIAREFNQSETTFIVDPTRKDADWKLRSLTASGVEVFGAGHNALGAWWWLAESGQLSAASGGKTFMQEIGEHVLPVEIEWEAGQPASVAMTQGRPVNGRIVDDLPGLAQALGLRPDDLVTERVPAQVVSTGAPHLLVPVRSCDDVDRVRANADALLAVLQAVHGQGCYVFSLEARASDADAYARFFNPTLGIVEDPGTGSAAGPLACHLATHGITQRDRAIVIEQGRAMGRRSLIQARVTGAAVQISGACATVAEGVLKLTSNQLTSN
jgi:trans-2,3-dihydro-3-hydroxyanthranilate isomerase